MAGSSIASRPRAELVQARTAALAHYSPYFFLRQLSPERQQDRFGTGAAHRFGGGVGEEVVTSGPVQWLLHQLSWDTAYFGTPVYRLFTGLYADSGPAGLRQAVAALQTELASRGVFYAYSIVPAEDVTLLQALTGAGWALVETRLSYYHDAVAEFTEPRYPVRLARPDEADLIGRVAAACRNPYDRFHADPWFGADRADAFLAHYAAATVGRTYGADAVLVPAAADIEVDSFLAISDLLADAQALGTAMSRVVLTAAGPRNRGWHRRLVAETLHRARALNQSYVLMTTQATNQAVFRTCEKLGFRLGATAHVLACHLSLPA